MNCGVEGVETRMVGREQEMRRAQEIAQAVINENELCFINLTGEARLGRPH